ncbi:MAG: biopolymer transporter ExbD [Chitinophagales bacterium]|nr:biopolymer transporter ExbD [Chitinophagaceae bacterium]MCB9065530.1 biopolymer transporter ExbD [Chitinophagales bacterium]
MAELNIPEKKGRRRRTAPRVDLTPMVDLGFLLITFFILTTTMAKDKSIEINNPIVHAEEPTKFIDTATITLIPIEGHKVAYYNGMLSYDEALQVVPISDVRAVLVKKKSELKRLPITYSEAAHKIQVLIKPYERSKYDDLVSLIDEMLINDIKTYTIYELDSMEKRMVREL